MSGFRRAKLAHDAFRNFISKATNRQIGSPISQKFGFPNKACRSYQQHYNPFLDGAKWFYCVVRNQVHHFQPRGQRRWFQNRRNLVLLGSGIVITLYFGCETVPYTKRNHLVLLSRDMERKFGEMLFDSTKKSFERDILPANHPESVRVRLIAKEIIEALQHDVVSSEGGPNDPGVESRKKGKSHSHLEGLDWEVIVVDQPIVNAFCSPNGKIVVYTGLLKFYETDAEVATCLGHEVAHVVARHLAEKATIYYCVPIPLIIHLLFFMADIVNTISNILLRLPFSLSFSWRILPAVCVWVLAAHGIESVYLPRKMELEADYIGLLLLHSAGYDPRVAPKFYQKIADDDGDDDSALQNYLSSHPSGKKRAQLLSQAQVMQEALDAYRQSKLGREGEGFL